MRRLVRRCRKRSYPTRGEALASLEHCQERGRGERRLYWCWEHQAWHLSSQELTDPPRLPAPAA